MKEMNNEMESSEIEKENEAKNSSETEKTPDEKNKNKRRKKDSKEEKIKELEIKIDEHNDKYLRLYSEYENFRKRTAKERLELIGSASEKVILTLLPILDDFKRAITHNATSEDIESIKNGFDLIANKMNKIMENHGLKTLEAKDKLFDADIHEAITKIPAANEEQKNKIIDVIEEGYYLGEKIIRFPKVVVGE